MLAKCGINYQIFGTEGKFILCMHGWGGQIDSFKPLIRDLTAESGKARVIGVDFPGHGQSPEPPEVWNVDQFKAQIIALLDEIGAERVDIVAHSFGGRVALLMAAENPERVGRMVLTGCAGLLPKRSGGAQVKQAVFGALKAGYESRAVQKLLGKNAEKLTNAIQSRMGSADYRALSGDMRKTFVQVINQDLAWCLPKIKASYAAVLGRKRHRHSAVDGSADGKGNPGRGTGSNAGRNAFCLPRALSQLPCGC